MAEVTIRDVASEAGLSVSSVSRILRGGQGHVYPTSTHDRVREIADRLGYKANVAARLLRQSTRTLIGISTHLTEHPHLNRFLVTLRSELIQRGYDPVILDAQQLSGAEQGQAFPPLHMLAGLINLGFDLEHGCPEHYAAIRKNIPIVAMQAISNDASKWIDAVHVDFENSYGQAIKHLLDLGHKKIAYLGPIDGVTPNDSYKYEGWKAAAKEFDLEESSFIPWSVYYTRAVNNLTNPSKNTSLTGSDDIMSQARIQQAVIEVATTLESMNPRPTAVICASDEVAICLQSCLLVRGWKLPEDLSIIGYDGISFGAYAFPALTTIAPDYQAMAEAAIQLLLSHISEGNIGEKEGTKVFIKPHLILRESTTRVQ
jgi:LacI family transcriptional regulator